MQELFQMFPGTLPGQSARFLLSVLSRFYIS